MPRFLQEPNKRSKPSALRRTLQALRQRLTKRSRAKPPDWFLEKFSNASNTDKIGKTGAMDDAALSSEIRGSSALCNRLSVDPTLQSHYRVSPIGMHFNFCNPLANTARSSGSLWSLWRCSIISYLWSDAPCSGRSTRMRPPFGIRWITCAISFTCSIRWCTCTRVSSTSQTRRTGRKGRGLLMQMRLGDFWSN